MSERWIRCGCDVLTPLGVHVVLTYDVDGPSVTTEDDEGREHTWDRSELDPCEPVPLRRHLAVVAKRNAAIAERDRLRAELEALRDKMLTSHRDAERQAIDIATWPMSTDAWHAGRSDALRDVADRLNAILRGES